MPFGRHYQNDGVSFFTWRRNNVPKMKYLPDLSLLILDIIFNYWDIVLFFVLEYDKIKVDFKT